MRSVVVTVATPDDERSLVEMLRVHGYDVEPESELMADVDDDGMCPSCARYMRTAMDEYLMPPCEGEHCPFACPHVEPERAAALAKAMPLDGDR
jgi:hypothetical protein